MSRRSLMQITANIFNYKSPARENFRNNFMRKKYLQFTLNLNAKEDSCRQLLIDMMMKPLKILNIKYTLAFMHMTENKHCIFT